MRKKFFILLVLLLASNDIAYGKHGNNTKVANNKKHKNYTHKTSDRIKRSSNINSFLEPTDDDIVKINKITERLKEGKSDDAPFWGARGRRESSSIENLGEMQQTPYEKYCPRYSKTCFFMDAFNFKNDFPFWANRGRRDSGEENDVGWDERVRRQEEDDPFWGSRGRRNEDEPFWGSRGRRYKATLVRDEDTPFWGNRGRRKLASTRNNIHNEDEPFWGNRGKKEKYNQVMDEDETFWASRGKRQKDISISPVISDLESDFESPKIPGIKFPSFWANRGRDSKLRHLFTGALRSRFVPDTLNKEGSVGYHLKPTEQNTVHDDRIYAEEPSYILIERSSRASQEDDPYIITRGKKYSNRLSKAIRSRRGALEDIVKSVKNDPFYIARGKKDSFVKVGNTIMSLENLTKNKEVVCGIINTLINKGSKFKRDVNDSERDRRTILKKLAAQLQEDPYFVSRGKKAGSKIDDKMQTSINDIIEMCS